MCERIRGRPRDTQSTRQLINIYRQSFRLYHLPVPSSLVLFFSKTGPVKREPFPGSFSSTLEDRIVARPALKFFWGFPS
jgi:hypothetical protein